MEHLMLVGWMVMSRLIDADKLIEIMDDRYKEKVNKVPDNLAEGFMQMEKLIKEQPTAYDVDKVVEELEELRDEAQEKFERLKGDNVTNLKKENAKVFNLATVLAFKEAIGIVKAGGLDE